MRRLARSLQIAGAWASFAMGCIGVVVPVLPTTPFLLLAAFLFARSSPRMHAWLCSTKVHQRYVAAFRQAGGIPLSTKVRLVGVSYAMMGASALVVQKPLVWAVLGCVAVFLLYLMAVRIPTIKQESVDQVRAEDAA
ncbi:YbaN family protein [Adlercreutzia murintestinalis]|uniref:YbaN family protein n=1 Tax=Adlercreutzia murintestinalis TaxID=2941325 RepID=UPI00203CB6F5|nr:YbaN family protein [Adlercreutzia murintestinalis]